jgi:TRAP-type C4-dicarboxylate transport system permease small subunit
VSTPGPIDLPVGRPDEGPKRGPEAWLFYLGAAALLFAMVTDAVAVIGRHVGLPLLGSIELVQASMLVAASAAIVSATVAEKHAVVHLLIDRLSPAARGIMQRIHAALCALFFLALAAGSMWIAFDLRGGHEESELLSIPYAPLRMVCILAVLGVALVSLARVRGRRGSS